MTSPPREISIKCPKCATTYKTWWRASMNLSLDDFDDDYIEKMSTGTCPECGFKVRLETLVVDHDGRWQMGAELGAP